MIRKVSANQPSFHPVTFGSGMNLVIADATPSSTDKDTRNGVGKTSLIEIIHYCLGSSPRKGDTLKEPPLANWEFTVDVDLGGCTVSTTRSIAQPKHVLINSGDGTKKLAIPEWTELLGKELFDLPVMDTKSIGPSFRSLISYIARRERYAYDKPFDHYSRQSTSDRQVNMGYLLGLGWRDAGHFEALRRRKKLLDAENNLAKAAQKIAGDIHRSPRRGRLDAERLRLAQAVGSLDERLRSFRVLPEYARIQDEANRITRRIQRLENESLSDRNLLDHYRLVSESEQVAEDETLELFEAAQIELPDAIRREISELRAFHRALIINRAQFVQNEIGAIESRIVERDSVAASLDAERADRLTILESHGALDEYTQLHARLSKLRTDHARVVDQLAALERRENGGRALKRDALETYEAAKIAHEERQPQRERAVSLFNSYSEFLYEEPGNLLLEVRQTRDMPTFDFGIEIPRSKATGIERMKTLCLDLTIAALWAGCPKRPGFLIHDSTLFDGVDERQRAKALVLAEREARERGYQYILALNSDQVPTSRSTTFDPKSFERLRLVDHPPEGSLFGMRF